MKILIKILMKILMKITGIPNYLAIMKNYWKLKRCKKIPLISRNWKLETSWKLETNWKLERN